MYNNVSIFIQANKGYLSNYTFSVVVWNWITQNMQIGVSSLYKLKKNVHWIARILYKKRLERIKIKIKYLFPWAHAHCIEQYLYLKHLFKAIWKKKKKSLDLKVVIEMFVNFFWVLLYSMKIYVHLLWTGHSVIISQKYFLDFHLSSIDLKLYKWILCTLWEIH